MEMTLAWKNNLQTPFVVNLVNNGTVPETPDDCIVEVPGNFKDGEMVAIENVHLTAEPARLLQPHCEQHRLTVSAALGNDLDAVVKAMQHDPMNAWIEDEEKIKL